MSMIIKCTVNMVNILCEVILHVLGEKPVDDC